MFKILYVTTISDTMDFFPSHINMILDQGHTVDMACNVIKPINLQLLKRGCKVFNIEFQRSPFKKENYSAYKKLKKLIQDEKYDLVHTHTPVASVCVRLTCRKMKNIKVFYTAHGFHFFKGAPKKNWLIYYPIEKWLARYTDVLITINKEDYKRARKFKAKKVVYVPGVGIDVTNFSTSSVDRWKKRIELGIPDETIVLLSIGELSKRKNHKLIIKSLRKINRPDIIYIICGQGELDVYLKKLAEELNVSVKFLGYREDIAEICYAADIFVFPSYQEGLPVALMEAMSTGLPVICSRIRGNTDLIEESKGGYLVDSDDTNGFAKAIVKLINESSGMGKHNIETVRYYDIQNVIKKMKELYEAEFNKEG
ncbi:glycosyltransferase family 4 protein [Clostridium sediminicola]|uniref:glycosyltransferase family 4 protein n=1 Tax=Clostridium sediminicola TaxID=3114879 RepID=UPI0031F270DA